MKERRLHLYIVTLLLSGPVITFIAGLSETFDFLFYLFPVTIESIDLGLVPVKIREFRIGGIVLLFFNTKIILFGLIVFKKLKQGADKITCLRRFYVMILLMTSIRLLMLLFFYNTDGLNFIIGLVGHLIWIIGLVWVIRKRTHTLL